MLPRLKVGAVNIQFWLGQIISFNLPHRYQEIICYKKLLKQGYIYIYISDNYFMQLFKL